MRKLGLFLLIGFLFPGWAADSSPIVGKTYPVNLGLQFELSSSAGKKIGPTVTVRGSTRSSKQTYVYLGKKGGIHLVRYGGRTYRVFDKPFMRDFQNGGRGSEPLGQRTSTPRAALQQIQRANSTRITPQKVDPNCKGIIHHAYRVKGPLIGLDPAWAGKKEQYGHSEPLARWQECRTRAAISGNMKDYGCTNKRIISKPFANFMDEAIFACAQHALKTMGLDSRISRISLTHNGILGDARHKPGSYHSLGRAIDLSSLKIIYPNNTSKQMNYSNACSGKKTEASFFETFRSCWTQKVHADFGGPQKASGSTLRGCQHDQKGHVGCEDRYHKNHLHLSLPFCPRKKGNLIYFKS